MARYEWKTGTHALCITLLALLLLALVPASPALCDVEKSSEAESETEEQEAPRPEIEPYTSASVQSGYRFITPDGPIAAASPYGRLKSGASGGYSAATLGSDLKISVDGMFLHEDDYHTELFLDYSGLVRFHAESGALWHNLLTESLPPGSPSYFTRDSNPDATFGVRVATTQAETRVKLGNNPFHINLGYWQLTREGFEQLLFSDHSFGGTNSGSTQNTIISQASRVDRITREGRVGLDGHLGWFDLSYGFLIRDFSNNAPDNRFQFANTANNSLIAGIQAHDTIPDSRLTSHTIKMFSDLSGGLVGTAAYTLTQRENSGGHGDALPSSRPADTIHTMAGDISYTPFKQLSFAMKYRHQEINRDTPASLFYPFSQIPATGTIPGVYTTTPGNLLVRPGTDTIKDSLVFSSIIRPSARIIYRLEYRAELESRDNIRDPQSPAGSPFALHSDSRQTHTGKASLYWKPYNGLKLDAFYSYAVCDNPAYMASFSDRHTGKLLLTYTSNGKWGGAASYSAQYESGESNASTTAPAPVATWNLPRESRNNSANLSFWFSPVERLTVSSNYSYLESFTNQTMLFAANITDASPLSATNFYSSAHVYGIDLIYAVSEPLEVSLDFQQVRSISRFGVPSRTFNAGIYDTAGITDLTRLEATETGVSARADWRINALIGCMLDYSFRLYDSGNPVVDGSVHTTMLSLKARW